MRFIHTSDWHLGRSFHRVGLLDAQALYLDHLVEVVKSEGVDAVLVSGDVYDRALPAPDTVELLSDAVTGSSMPARSSCCPAATTTRRFAWASPRSFWPGRGFTSGPVWARWGRR